MSGRFFNMKANESLHINITTGQSSLSGELKGGLGCGLLLSVLIPTFDHKCYTLVAELQRQLEAAGYGYEIIVADDGGRDQVCAIANLRINELPQCRFIRRRENVGRAAIKNFLAREARGEWLLFIDSDAEVTDPHYIRRLLDAISDAGGTQVIIGGLRHADTMPSPEVSLRYLYEKEADRHRTARERSIQPYRHMTPFNLCVRHSVMQTITFDEQCREYGYEDALFGVTLQQNGIGVTHIDNPLLHTGLENNAVYLAKAETALRTLHCLGDRMMRHSHVGQAAITLQRWHVKGLAALLFRVFRPIMRRNLLGKKPSLTVFSLYKLGYLCTIS